MPATLEKLPIEGWDKGLTWETYTQAERWYVLFRNLNDARMTIAEIYGRTQDEALARAALVLTALQAFEASK